jgi:endogenous inhibitor of DNA gyrase (YacG/DUF329 family)
MVKCPWCGKEVSTEEYGSHYETCPKRLVATQLAKDILEKEAIINQKIRENKYHIEEITEETDKFYYVTIAVWKED